MDLIKDITARVNRSIQSGTPAVKNVTESVQEETSSIEAPKTDTFTISERPENPVYERPVNFVTNYGHLYKGHNVLAETDLFVRLRNQLPPMFHQYFEGNIDKESVLRTLDHAVSDLVAYYGGKDFDPADITQDILEDLYTVCRIEMVNEAHGVSYVEGRQVTQEMGSASFTVYYNSDYYYKTEDLIDTVHDHFEALSIKYGCGPMELERDFPEGDIRNTRYASYNSYFNASLRGNGGSMIDWTMPPPKNFKMFYDTNNQGLNRYPESMGIGAPDEPSLFDSAVYIQYGDWTFAHRVPVRKDPTQYPISVHLMDVIYKSGKNYPAEIRAFLDNFDFFATNIGKEYTDAHPLVY